MRTAARIDRNQPEIVAYFRAQGFSVLIISQLKNCCDIVIAKDGKTAMIEIKDGDKKKLTSGEMNFRDNWKGLWFRVNGLEDAEGVCRLFL